MSGNEVTSPTGSPALIIHSFETRRVVLAQGIEGHESDARNWNQTSEQWATELESNPGRERLSELLAEIRERTGYSVPEDPSQRQLRNLVRQLRDATEILLHEYLEGQLGADYTRISDDQAEYTSTGQRVHFTIRVVTSKAEYKRALETEELHVVYSGHSRYGRGACFAVYDGSADPHGDQWECGTSRDDGLYRLAYPFVPVSLSDLSHHRYQCRPVAVEDGAPPRSERHPNGRRGLRSVNLPDELRQYVAPYYESPSNQYYGVRLHGKQYILMYADWVDTVNQPYDLGATNLRCRVFCHFGCSSRLHYWRIVRRDEYKGWSRPVPPADRYAYFTTAPSYGCTAKYWLRHWFAYSQENSFQPWWESLQYAKGATNRQLRTERLGYRIY